MTGDVEIVTAQTVAVSYLAEVILELEPSLSLLGEDYHQIVSRWNEGPWRTRAEVLDVFDEAIRRAEADLERLESGA